MTRCFTTALIAAALPLMAQAQAQAQAQDPAPVAGDAGWRDCAALADGQARLVCFDQWAGRQAWAAPAASANAQPVDAVATTPATPLAGLKPPDAADDTPGDGCRGTDYTTLSRFWELEAGTDCGALRFRGYRPMSVSVVGSDSVNQRPTSASPGHSAARVTDYRKTEMRLQLSVRTKLAKGLLTPEGSQLRDSLWFGYSQQSYWQLFNADLSRPFRNTDHEPEFMYVYPTDASLPGGWRWRYSGVGLVHQSNGQSLPLSRSWNRVYLMTGLELQDRWYVNARIWKRVHESRNEDDNPDIGNYVGRAELGLGWNVNQNHTLTFTARHSLGSTARGSVRLDWLHRLGTKWVGASSNLRLHTQLFSGYGDSLIDYNRKRTVFSVGVSLLDF